MSTLMLERLSLRNFKCHPHLDLQLKSLTLLTGLNAGGKSSCLQGALLMAQALRYGNQSRKVSLNGEKLRLGLVRDILFQPSDQKFTDQDDALPLEFGFSTADCSISWKFQTKALNAQYIEVSEVRVSENSAPIDYNLARFKSLEQFLPSKAYSYNTKGVIKAIREISYLGLERLGTKELFPSPDAADLVRGDVGSAGQFAPWCLTQFSEDDADPARSIPSKHEIAETLRRQLNAWGAELFPGFEANASPLERTGLVILQLRTSLTEDFRKPANVGFGLFYAFPILIAGLTAAPGQTLIVDSPEAHLHPRAQSMMGRFLAVVAAAGVRVIAETHSDHVMNGIRVAIKDGILPPTDAGIYFFHKEHAESLPILANIDKDGRIDNWPDGFFDQIESDLARL